jgi:hypothetical protein
LAPEHIIFIIVHSSAVLTSPALRTHVSQENCAAACKSCATIPDKTPKADPSATLKKLEDLRAALAAQGAPKDTQGAPKDTDPGNPVASPQQQVQVLEDVQAPYHHHHHHLYTSSSGRMVDPSGQYASTNSTRIILMLYTRV